MAGKTMQRVLFTSLLLAFNQLYAQFIDPAPPKVAKIVLTSPPKPQKHASLTFHKAPKALAKGAITHDWQTFLGPTHNAISSETHLLQKFPANGLDKVWEVAKGQGYASVAVIGEKVLLFHRVGEEEIVECLQATTGQRFWQHRYATAYVDQYGFGNGPRCQPVSDGEYVYTFGAEGKLHCLYLPTGQVVWGRDLDRDFKLKSSFFGVGSTPLLEGDLLIINLGAVDGPCVAAFDKHTGKMVWGTGKQWGASYASPIPTDIDGQRRVLVFAGGKSRPPVGGLLAIDPKNGQIEHRFSWRSRRFTSVNASSPVIIGEQVYLSECYGRGGVLLQLLPQGECKKIWDNRTLQAHFMTPIYKDGYLYGVDGHSNSPLVCVELKSGKEMWRFIPQWQTKVTTPSGEKVQHFGSGLASLLQVDGRCLLLGQYGHLAWLDLNPKGYRELDHTQLFVAKETWSLPSLSRGLLYICQNDNGIDGSKPRLICYDLRGKK